MSDTDENPQEQSEVDAAEEAAASAAADDAVNSAENAVESGAEAEQDGDAGDADTVEAADSEVAAAPAEAGVLAYDFVHPTHRLNSHLPVLDVINEKLAKALTVGLVRQFRLPVQVECTGTHFEKYQDYTASLSPDVSIQRIRLDPVQGNALLITDGDLIFALVDSFFGGIPVAKPAEPEAPVADDDAETENSEEQGDEAEAEAQPEPPPRRFTPTEQRIIDRVRENVFLAMSESWATVQPISPRLMAPLIRSEITSPANPSAVVVCSRFQVRLRGAEGEIHLMIPYASLEPIRSKLSNDVEGDAANDQAWRKAFMRQLLGCEVDVNGVFAETRITMRQLMNLKVGDFIPLGQVQSVEFSSEGVPLFDAAVGVSNGMVSASVTRWHERRNIKKKTG